MIETPRRRVLAAAATGSTLGIAGCSGLADDGDATPTQTDDGAGDGDGGDDAAATVALDVQAEIQAAREEITTRVEEGNLTQEEARSALRDEQVEIVSAAIEDLESYAADTGELSVERANEQAGAALVAGAPAAVLGTLEADPVSALLSASDFPEPPDGGQPNGS